MGFLVEVEDVMRVVHDVELDEDAAGLVLLCPFLVAGLQFVLDDCCELPDLLLLPNLDVGHFHRDYEVQYFEGGVHDVWDHVRRKGHFFPIPDQRLVFLVASLRRLVVPFFPVFEFEGLVGMAEIQNQIIFDVVEDFLGKIGDVEIELYRHIEVGRKVLDLESTEVIDPDPQVAGAEKYILLFACRWKLQDEAVGVFRVYECFCDRFLKLQTGLHR